MLSAADILLVVEPAAPEHEPFADRVHRDLCDWGYQIQGAAYTATLKVAWSDKDGWTLTYNNQAQTFTLRSIECLCRVLYEDRILVNQKWLPPGRLRPFTPTLKVE
jgi:hypothetical protein